MDDLKLQGYGLVGCFRLRIIESEGLESDMSKVRNYQLSAHQQLQFKVRT